MSVLGDELREAAREGMVDVQVTMSFLAATGTFVPTTLKFTAVETPVEVHTSPLLDYDQRLVDGKNIRAQDCYILYVPAEDDTLVPVEGMTVIEGSIAGETDTGNRWSIIHVKSHRADDGDPIVYEIQLRS